MYSGDTDKDGNHRLITTAGNSCRSFEKEGNGLGKNCYNCVNCVRSGVNGLTLYCNVRTYENDPYNPED